MFVVGLTGGIGSGKSTVARMLAERGAVIIDADALAREVVEPGTDGFAQVVDRFGDEVVAADGSLDREALASIVFDDEHARADLNAIVHPAVGERMAARMAAAEEHDPDGVVVLDIPLLAETGRTDGYAAVVVVVAPEDVRVERLHRDRGMDPSDARARIAAQASDDERRAIATHVIDNGGDLDDLERQVDEIWQGPLAEARA